MLFCCLIAFKKTGGIEKFNRCFAQAMSSFLGTHHLQFRMFSLYDKAADNRYVSSRNFKGFKGNKFLFLWRSLLALRNIDMLYLGHINLALLVVLVKLVKPKVHICLVVHGIEAWYPVSRLKAKALRLCDSFVTVSNFSSAKLISVHHVPASKITIVPNTIDPNIFNKTDINTSVLKNFYAITTEHNVLITVARFAHSERLKGYETVLKVIRKMKLENRKVVYLMVGDYEPREKRRLEHLAATLEISDNVHFTGYIEDDLLPDYYQMSDVFVMPSKKEGFGIVFIEALASGLGVVAGENDGSVDALNGGKFGYLVNPDDVEEVKQAVLDALNSKVDRSSRIEEVYNAFGFGVFKKKIIQHLLHSYTCAKVS